MFLWDRKVFIISMIIIGGIFFVAGSFNTTPQVRLESNLDKLADYLYSAPIIVKRIKSFFSFSELPIYEVLRKSVVLNNTKGPDSGRARILPTPTASPIALKPRSKNEPGDSNVADVNNYNKPKFSIETVNQGSDKKNNKMTEDKSDFGKTTIVALTTSIINSAEQTINEWKYRLFMNPSKDNMNDFIQLYQSNKITSEVYYGVLKALVNESDDRSQAIAIYGLSAIQSYESYEILSIKVDEKSLMKENQVLAYKNLEYYAKIESLKVLLVALKGASDVVTLQALHSVSLMIESQSFVSHNQSATKVGYRETRGAASVKFKKESYSSLVNALKELTRSSKTQIAILAENNLQQFQEAVVPQPNYNI